MVNIRQAGLEELASSQVFQTGTVVFEFDPVVKTQYLSSCVSSVISGNYDGRFAFQVMLEDHVVHPEDRMRLCEFADRVMNGGCGQTVVRLLTPEQSYRYFRLTVMDCVKENGRTLIGIVTDINEEIEQRQSLEYLERYDPISGIYCKEVFYQDTRRLLENEPDKSHYLVRFDIDRFKMINELYSFREGDLVLGYIGGILKRLCRANETYARFGDDIFCICLSREEEEVKEFIGQLEREANCYPIAFRFKFSAGIVKLVNYAGQPVDILCDWAAMAQRTIKGSYIKSYAFYDESISLRLKKEHAITMSMQEALDQGQFLMYLQPKYDIITGELIGSEALVRWIHPQRGMVPPVDFIPLFERNGFILPLDEFIWERACRTLRYWLDSGMNAKPISVNVSRIHLYDPAFCEKICGLIHKYHLPPEYLELEVTESAYVECQEVLFEIMDTLQAKGIRFSMDDFGSGYSSLNILKDIPVDMVKLDLNFLKEARRGERVGNLILKGVVELLKSLDMPLIVEGVENQEQEALLKRVGCRQAQGYYYAKPMTVEEMERIMAG